MNARINAEDDIYVTYCNTWTECVFITMQQKQKWSSILYLFDKRKIITAILLIQKLGIFFYVILIIDMWKD